MKKLIAAITILLSLFMASPAFAYTVKYGDTMTQIARNHHLTLQELAKLNPQIQDLDLILIGQLVKTSHSETDTHVMKVGYSDYEIDLLARLVRAEAEGEPYNGKVAVACVVLNRVESPRFPNTIRNVIYEKGQFQPVQNGEINQPADLNSIKAVRDALTVSRHMVGHALFFYNPATAESHWLDSRTTAMQIGRHVFKI